MLRRGQRGEVASLHHEASASAAFVLLSTPIGRCRSEVLSPMASTGTSRSTFSADRPAKLRHDATGGVTREAIRVLNVDDHSVLRRTPATHRSQRVIPRPDGLELI